MNPETPENFNYTHPELLENEHFIMNTRYPNEFKLHAEKSYSSIRIGNVAYTPAGVVVQEMKPIFGKLKLKN